MAHHVTTVCSHDPPDALSAQDPQARPRGTPPCWPLAAGTWNHAMTALLLPGRARAPESRM
eukprot:4416525-Prymnesium_polylepis.1